MNNSKIRYVYKIKNVDISRLVLILYIVLTIIFTYPVAFSNDKIPGGGDAYWHIWNLWHYKTALLSFNDPYYTTYIFYPTGVNLAFSTVTPFNAILSVPLQSIFGLILAYNILWLISFIIAGYGTYLLVKYLTNDIRAAFISGLIFMFSPYHFAHALGHLNLTTIEWIPFYVLYLYRTINEDGEKNAIYAAFFLLLVTLSEYYYLIYMLSFTIIFFIYYLLTDKKNILQRGITKRLSIMMMSFGLVLFPFIYSLSKELITSKSNYMYIGGFDTYSADILGFFTPTSFHPILAKYAVVIYKNFTGNYAENTVFIGYIVLFLAFFAIFKIKTKEIKFWSLSTMIFFIFTLGPVLHVNGKLLDFIPLPYSMIMNIPIISIARVPSRWDVLVMLCFAVLAGYGLSYILSHNREDKCFNKIFKKDIIMVIFLGIILFEYLAIPYPMASTEIPTFYHQSKDNPEDYAIIDVPIRPIANYMYYQTVHGKKLIGGYVSRMPPDAMTFIRAPFIDQLYLLSKDMIINGEITDYGRSILNYYNIRYIVLHEKYMNKDQIDIANVLLQNISAEKKVYKEDQLTVYKIEKMRPKSFILLADNFNIEGQIAWISNNATILSYSPEIRDSNLYLNIASFYRPRLLYIYLNDKMIHKQIIKATPNRLELKLNLKEGENMIRFYSPDDCQRPIDIPELKSKDARCLGMILTNIVST